MLLLYALSIFPPSSNSTDMPRKLRSQARTTLDDESFLPTSGQYTFPPPSSRPTAQTSVQQMKSSNNVRLSSMDVDSTPGARGSATLTAYEERLDKEDANYYRQNYKAYIEEDLDHNRVYVPADDFLRVVFNVTFEARHDVRYQALIEAISTDKAFARAWSGYLGRCSDNRTGPRTEKILYDSRVDVYNAALEYLDKHYPDDVAPEDRIRFYKNDPVRLKYGVYADGVSPDLGYVYQQLLLLKTRTLSDLRRRTLGAAMLVGVEEMKARDGTLLYGNLARFRTVKTQMPGSKGSRT
ncbi:hypothetical protein CPB85DRAFT_452704 [Mucidula mucida]|nr:hypothetical protein CPB85DRAFT_452704 [Mucidula mucida]